MSLYSTISRKMTNNTSYILGDNKYMKAKQVRVRGQRMTLLLWYQLYSIHIAQKYTLEFPLLMYLNILSTQTSLNYSEITLKLQNFQMVDRSELLVDTSNGHTLPQFNILQFLLFETLSFLTFLYIYVLVLLFSRWPLSKSSFQTRFSTQFHKAKLQHSPQFIYSPSGTSLTTMTLATTFTEHSPNLHLWHTFTS